ncbi:hypothetical protein [Candidatus Entotheonella palauensis]|uniref:hypothetical protein n=1 Tax=Candidatus Entotheonella palauensis TaxID=93172 RepID=UPI0011783ABF|nr:hypothetical protein [Candidatus Entotheonella palauensis]
MNTSPYARAASCVIEPSNLAAMNHESIEHWIVHRLSECTGFDPEDIDTELPCTAYGREP